MFSSNTSQTSGGYEIQRSLRFNSADSAYLNRTLTTPTDNKKFTMSLWVKRSGFTSFGVDNYILGVNSSSGIYFTEPSILYFQNGGGTATTTAVFRDPSSWYHLVFVFDSANATANDRMIIYVNNVRQALTTNTPPSLNATGSINSAISHDIGRYISGLYYFPGYMTEVNFIDGQALTPSSFGAYDAQTGVWGPTPYAGSYGTNGFYLNFSDNSNTTAATLGKDYSGNSNNWTPNNFSVSAGAGNDSLVDVPTNWGTDTGVGGSVRGNYATLNPLALGASGSLANGNLEVSYVTGGRTATGSTFGMLTGKWYWEATITATNLTNTTAIVGLTTDSAVNVSTSYPGSIASSWGYYGNDGTKYNAGSASAYGAVFGLNDVIGVAFDADAGTLTFYKNGTSQGTAFSSLTSGPYYPTVGNGASVYTFTSAFNFGQRPFAYTAPSGFKALNTQNLPTPTIGATTATQAGKFFNPVLWTANGGVQTITGAGLQPDFLWIKDRQAANSHTLHNIVVGSTKYLESNTTSAEITSANYVTSIDSDGWSIGSSNYLNGRQLVSWCWKANGAGVTNTAGSITSTVSANTTSGFSVVTFTGINAGATVGHGLGAVPQMIIMKARSGADNWYVYHVSIGAPNYLTLNTTNASAAAGSVWLNTTPTSSVFSIGNNTGTLTQVAYCFAEVPGYSRFGSYTGNGSADGPFCFTGFRPAFVMAKRTDGAGDWWIVDDTRSAYNQTANVLNPNSSDAEYAGTGFNSIDILANGFKVRTTNTSSNGSGATYIFMALAEAPQKFALAR